MGIQYFESMYAKNPGLIEFSAIILPFAVEIAFSEITTISLFRS
jgi:hypothetical protein